MIMIDGKEYYTAREFAAKVKVQKSYVCRLARSGKLRHVPTDLGYLLPVDTIDKDWEARLQKEKP